MKNSTATNIPNNSYVEDDRDSKKNKKKHFITSLSQKIQRRVTKGIVKSFIDINNSNNSPKLIKSVPEGYNSNSTNNSDFETNRERRFRELKEKREQEEERENNSKDRKTPILLPPVPPRISSHNNPPKMKNNKNGNNSKIIPDKPVKPKIPIPLRGSSSNFNIKLFNSELFDNYFSKSLPNNKETTSLNLKRSLSDIIPSSNTENPTSGLSDNKSINETISISKTSSSSSKNIDNNSNNSQSSNINSINNNKEVSKDGIVELSLSSDSSSDSSTNTNKSQNNDIKTFENISELSSKTSINKSNSNFTSSSNFNINDRENEGTKLIDLDYSSDKTLNESLVDSLEESFSQIYKSYSSNSINNYSEKINQNKDIKPPFVQKINDIFKSDTKKYMDHQLTDLFSNYFKNDYYDESDSSGDKKLKDNQEEKYETKDKQKEKEENNDQIENCEQNESKQEKEIKQNEPKESMEEKENIIPEMKKEIVKEKVISNQLSEVNTQEIEYGDQKDDDDESFEFEDEVDDDDDDNNDNNDDASGFTDFIENDFATNHPFIDHSYIIKSNSSNGYFVPNSNNRLSQSTTPSSGSLNKKDLTKRYTLPSMDSKHISPKIITCTSDDPSKPATHLVNISGVTIQTNDLSHLFWVPSYLHPELHPQEFKKWVNNDSSDHFGRRLSIRRTKSFAESARVITPDSTSENGDPVVDQLHISRNKTINTFNNNINPAMTKPSHTSLKRSKNIRLKKSSSRGSGSSSSITEEDINNNNSTGSSSSIAITTTTTTTNSNNENMKIEGPTSTSTSTSSNLLPVSKSTSSITGLLKPTNTKPIYSSSLHNSTSIPDTSPELAKLEIDTKKPVHNPNSLLDTDYAEMESPPLVGMPDAIYAYKNNEIPPQKSGWSLWWSSFGKDDKKDSESSKKSKKSNANTSKSYFSFFKSSPKSSTTNLAEKYRNSHQGKGITEAYIIDGPLTFKPLTRPAEDAIFSISHIKLATTYRPMVQQVQINNLMQKYITLYQDAAFKIPFKTNRLPKKRRVSSKPQQANINKVNGVSKPISKQTTKQKQKPKKSRLPPNGPLIKDLSIKSNTNNLSTATTTTNTTSTTKTKNKTKNSSNDKKSKRKSLTLDFNNKENFDFDYGSSHKKKSKNNIYSNLNHSISTEHFDYINKKSKASSKIQGKFSKSCISLDWDSVNQLNDSRINTKTKSKAFKKHQRRYSTSSRGSSSSSSYSSSESESESDSDSENDDDVPLGVLRRRRQSISSINTV